MSRQENPKHPGLNLGAAHGRSDQAAEELMFGFWAFLMRDAIVFGLLFATYVTMVGSTAGGPGPKALFELNSAFVQTLLLLASSFTFGMASLALKYRHDRNRLLGWLGVTLALALAIVFLGFELHDFGGMADQGGVPSRSGFLSAFFALVPLHGLHMAAGSLWLIAIAMKIWRFGLDQDVKLGILRLGLFWHFLDIVWVGIFSVVYLAGRA